MNITISVRPRHVLGGVTVAVAALAGGAALASSQEVPSPSVGTSADWVADLDALDEQIRTRYGDPFVNISEVEWMSGLDELAERLPAASHDEAQIAVVELVAELEGGNIFVLPNSAVVVHLPSSITSTAGSQATHLPGPVPCHAPRPAPCPQ